MNTFQNNKMTEDDDNAFRIGNLMVKMDENTLNATASPMAHDDLEVLPQVAELSDNALFSEKLLTSLGQTDITIEETGESLKKEEIQNVEEDITLTELPEPSESLLNDAYFQNSLQWGGISGIDDEKSSLGSDCLDFLQNKLESVNSLFNFDDTNPFPCELFNMKLENENYSNFLQFDLVKDLCDFTKQNAKNAHENEDGKRMAVEGEASSASEVKIEMDLDEEIFEEEKQPRTQQVTSPLFGSAKSIKRISGKKMNPAYPRTMKSKKMIEDDDQKSRVRPVIHRRCKTMIKPSKTRSYHPRSEKNSIFACQKCDYSTTNRSNFKNHQLIHGEERMFQCPYCPYRSKQSAGLRAHYKVHSIEKPFQCSFCSYKSKRKQNLVQHLRIHSKERPFRCDQCAYRATTKQLLQNHLLWHVSVKNKTETGLKSPNNDGLECLLCHMSFSSEKEFSLHFQTHSDENVVSSTQENETLSKEIRNHLTSANLAFKCSKCDFVTLRKCALRNHIKSHNNKESYKCSVCDFHCTIPSVMAAHIESHKREGNSLLSSEEWITENQNNQSHETTTDSAIEDTPNVSPSPSYGSTDEKRAYQCPYCDFECLIGEVLKVHICNHPNDFLLGYRKRSASDMSSFETGVTDSPKFTFKKLKVSEDGPSSCTTEVKMKTGKTIVYPKPQFLEEKLQNLGGQGRKYNLGPWTNLKYFPWSSSSGKIHIAPNFTGKCFNPTSTASVGHSTPVWRNTELQILDESKDISVNSSSRNSSPEFAQTSNRSSQFEESDGFVKIMDFSDQNLMEKDFTNRNEMCSNDKNDKDISNSLSGEKHSIDTKHHDPDALKESTFSFDTNEGVTAIVDKEENECDVTFESTLEDGNEIIDEAGLENECAIVSSCGESPQSSLYSGSPVRSVGSSAFCEISEQVDTEASPGVQENQEQSIPKIFLCKECKTYFPKKSSLTNHLRVHSNKVFRCPLCPYTSKFLKTFLKHSKKHTFQGEFSCSECSFTTDKKNSLVVHYRSHANVYTCSHCGFTSKLIRDLEIHSLGHKEGMAIKCSSCDFVTDKFKILRLHMKKFHTKNLFSCVKCNAGFRDMNVFHDHLEMHFNAEKSLEVDEIGETVHTSKDQDVDTSKPDDLENQPCTVKLESNIDLTEPSVVLDKMEDIEASEVKDLSLESTEKNPQTGWNGKLEKEQYSSDVEVSNKEVAIKPETRDLGE